MDAFTYRSILAAPSLALLAGGCGEDSDDGATAGSGVTGAGGFGGAGGSEVGAAEGRRSCPIRSRTAGSPRT